MTTSKTVRTWCCLIYILVYFGQPAHYNYFFAIYFISSFYIVHDILLLMEEWEWGILFERSLIGHGILSE